MSNKVLIMDAALEQIETEELERRVIYSVFLPAVRLARLFNVPLKEMKSWLSVAYLHEMKRNGYTQQEVADRFDVSRRTIIDLSKRLKENFFRPEQHEGLARRILFMLWAEPMSEGRLFQALADDFEEEDIRDAVESLVGEEKIQREESATTVNYALLRHAFRLYQDNWIARIDALNHQVSGLTDTVFARFFANDTRGFVRTVGLSIRKEDHDELETFYREVVFPKLAALDSASDDDPDAELFEFSISWVPKDFIKRFELGEWS